MLTRSETAFYSQKSCAYVQCHSCSKWRFLPRNFDLSALPDMWTCNMHPSSNLTCFGAYRGEEISLSESTSSTFCPEKPPDSPATACINSVIAKNLHRHDDDDGGPKKKKRRRNSSTSTCTTLSEPYLVEDRRKCNVSSTTECKVEEPEGVDVAERDALIRQVYEMVAKKHLIERRKNEKQPVRRVSMGVQVDFDFQSKKNTEFVCQLLENHAKVVYKYKKMLSDVAKLLPMLVPDVGAVDEGNVQQVVDDLLGASLIMNFKQKFPI